MTYLRLAWALVSIAAFWLLVCLPLTILGFPLSVIGVALRRVEPSPITGKPISVPPRALWLWGNDQEGYEPAWYAEYRPKWPRWLRLWEWAAWRNSANNLRFVRWLNPKHDDPEDFVTYHASRFSLYWSGWRYRLLIDLPNGKHLIAGWKWDLNPQPWQAFGVGFGIRIKGPNAPIGAWEAGS